VHLDKHGLRGLVERGERRIHGRASLNWARLRRGVGPALVAAAELGCGHGRVPS
jgi:hypothetical protein